MNARTTKPRTGLIVGGAVVAVVALTVLAVAGVAIWTDVAKRDGSGYLTANAHRYASPTRAIATDELTIGTEVPKRLIGKVRLEATTSEKPVFVGIARTATVDAYLAGASYATAKDLDLDPFGVTYVTHSGTRGLERPASRTFWAASAVGSGVTDLTWTPRSGSWSVVVMNADGSPGVSADVSAGVKAPWLLWAGIGIALAGGILLAVAGLMLVRGAGPARTRRLPTPLSTS
jgi:hypothetical protein